MSQVTHNPTAILDYGFDWSKWPLNTNETISSATWTVDNGITRDAGSHPPAIVGSVTTIWLTGGTIGTRYLAQVHIVTSQGREADAVLEVDVVAVV